MIAYCDYIADRISTALKADSNKVGSLIGSVGKTAYDLSESGSFLSTKKTMVVKDVNGKVYTIIVKEV